MLAQLEVELIEAGVRHRSIREPDPPWNGALMAIGICPTDKRNEIRRFVQKLPLVRQ